MFDDFTINQNDKKNYIPIISEIDGITDEPANFPEILDILPLRNTVLFPGVIIPISIGRKKSLKLIKKAFENDKIIGIAGQKDAKIDNPTFENIYKIGTVAKIIKIFDMPDGIKTAVIQGLRRFEITKEISEKD